MNISAYHIQNVIRAYGQRVRRTTLTRLKADGQATPKSDVISISPEAKQRQIVETISSEIMSRVKAQGGDAELNSLVNKLKTGQGDFQELGQVLDLFVDGHDGAGLKFRVIDSNKAEVLKELSPEATASLISNLYNKLDVMTQDE